MIKFPNDNFNEIHLLSKTTSNGYLLAFWNLLELREKLWINLALRITNLLDGLDIFLLRNQPVNMRQDFDLVIINGRLQHLLDHEHSLMLYLQQANAKQTTSCA